MAVRQNSPQLNRATLFNIGGVGLVVLSLYLAVKLSFAPAPETPLCEVRYAGGVLFSLARKDGSPLAPEDLQARLSGHDRGLIRNARIVQDAGVPYGWALEVQLRRSAGQEEEDQSRSGIGMAWMPHQLPAAAAACLSYSVWLPEDFKGGEAGVLPGFVSEPGAEELPHKAAPAATAAEDEAAPRLRPFVSRPLWLGDGQLALSLVPNLGQGVVIPLEAPGATLKPGRWTRIEQELVLNQPGQLDGILRVWVDGKIVWELHGIGYRRDELQSLQAVVANVHNVRQGAWTASHVETNLRLSPLELRLR